MFKLKVTGGIHLELLDMPHAPALFELTQTNKAFLRQWLPWPDAMHQIEDTRQFIQKVKQDWADGKGLHCVIVFQSQLAGVIGFHEFNRHNDTASVGYWLGEQFQGYGLISQSLQVLLTHAFHDYAMNRVVIRCATENLPSRKVPERLGFHLDGILRANEKLHGHYVDHAVYSLLKG